MDIVNKSLALATFVLRFLQHLYWNLVGCRCL